jgi:hypothetical protein
VLAAAAPSLEPPRAVRATDEQPLVTLAAGGGRALLDAAVAVARAEEAAVAGGRVAVIGPDGTVPALREAMGLPSGGGAALLDQPVAVFSVDEAKGLEFDSVVVVEPAEVVGERRNGLRALYVALTRTTRRLHLVHAEALPAPLVGAALVSGQPAG